MFTHNIIYPYTTLSKPHWEHIMLFLSMYSCLFYFLCLKCTSSLSWPQPTPAHPTGTPRLRYITLSGAIKCGIHRFRTRSHFSYHLVLILLVIPTNPKHHRDRKTITHFCILYSVHGTKIVDNCFLH